MESKFKIISWLIAMFNVLAGIAFVWVEVENNLYWSGAFILNGFLGIWSIKRKLPISPLFLLSVYYMYWAMMHLIPNQILTEEGKLMEMFMTLAAFIAFLSVGWLYFVNRKRW